MRLPTHSLCLTLLALAACATPEPPPTPAPTGPATSSSALQDAVKMEAVKPEELPPAAREAATAQPRPGQTPRRSNPRNLKAMPVRPLEVAMNCRFRNETGYNGEARVDVRNGNLRRLNVQYNLPGRGSCEMAFESSHQTQRLPSVELRNTSTGCTARLWEQGDKATVSFTGCAAHCTNAETFQYVWPVLMDRRRGRCD